LSIECGSGTYVRALGRDIAAALGTKAVMSALRRTAIGGFRVDDSLPLDEVSADSVRRRLQPSLAAVTDMPRVVVSEAEVIEIRHGRPVKPRRCEVPADDTAASSGGLPCAEWAAVDSSGRLVAILRHKKAGELWPEINFEIEAEAGNS
jgi:tRNA pseudouridine55 synthase